MVDRRHAGAGLRGLDLYNEQQPVGILHVQVLAVLGRRRRREQDPRRLHSGGSHLHLRYSENVESMVARDLTAATLVTGLFALMLSCLTPEASSLVVSPASASLQVGGTVQLLATLQDANGGVLSGRVVTWMSSDGSVAIVNGSGLVTAVAPGQATITATSEGKSGSAAITVASPSGGGTVLLQENFDDPAFGVRGWYDNTRMTLSTVEHLLGSTGSLEIRFAPRATQPVWGSAARHLFQPTETVYLSYWVKYSANWVGSGHAYHPHEFYLMTTENGPEDGPSVSHLTVYVEDNYQGGIYPVLNSQDGQNIDQQRIGIDLTAITENRASCGCNGNTDGYATDCYDMGGGTRDNGKLWKTTTPALAVNRWQHVEAYFKLNSIQNGKGVSDGIVRYWVDGRLVIDHSDVLLRTGAHPTMKFNQLLIGPYIGDGSPVDQSLWVDNLTVATNKP